VEGEGLVGGCTTTEASPSSPADGDADTDDSEESGNHDGTWDGEVGDRD